MRQTRKAGSWRPLLWSFCIVGFAVGITEDAAAQGDHAELLRLFADWREFESPPMLDGAPDYTAETFALRYERFLVLRNRLHGLDPRDWPIPQQVDWHIVRAEMNGYDFNHRVLQPWARDPAYYNTIWTSRSDVPAHRHTRHSWPGRQARETEANACGQRQRGTGHGH